VLSRVPSEICAGRLREKRCQEPFSVSLGAEENPSIESSLTPFLWLWQLILGLVGGGSDGAQANRRRNPGQHRTPSLSWNI